MARSGPSAKYPDGKWVLSAEFSEWMMGLPYRHVTDPAIWEGASETAARQAALKACGNGVVPLQAAAAVLICLRYFLDDHPAARVNDETRRCPCGNELIRRRDEGHARYAARKFCSRECAKTYRSKA